MDSERDEHSPRHVVLAGASRRTPRLAAVLAGASRRTPRLAAVLAIVLIDSFIWWSPIPRPVFGALDELGHLTTAALLLSAWRPLPAFRWRFLAATLAASVLIDIDHIPSEVFHSEVLTAGTYRPYGHTLLVILVIAGLSRVLPARWRPIAAGIAAGFCLHLVRDLATGGASLLWPVGDWTVWYPYPGYLALLVFAALRPAGQPARGGGGDTISGTGTGPGTGTDSGGTGSGSGRLDAGVTRP
jgi:inner membrane protein